MFTGIVESLGKVYKIETDGSNKHFWISSLFTNELKIDQSVAHNGVCLTVVEIESDKYKVTAIDETLKRSSLGKLKPGDKINLERCMKADSRLDGHIVQGHVDTVAEVTEITEKEGSWLFTFRYKPEHAGHILVEKGSVTVNGTSLTCFDISQDKFTVAIIPFTFEQTNFHQLKIGDPVNIEFDIIGKYVQRMLNPYQK
ncbi:MAG: riboflavin synthase [Candidatus Cyclobacteriaceae bacterium M2_1C_046]